MNSSETSLYHLLSTASTQYWAPPFQRRYCWSRPQCKALVDDLWSAYKSKHEHFTGVIVLMRDQRDDEGIERQLLIDGQQRLTTAFLLLCAARDLFQERVKDNMSVEAMRKKLLFFDDFLNRQADADSLSRLRVLPTLEDRPVLNAIERSQVLTKEQSKSSIAQAYEVLKQELDLHCARAEQIVDVLKGGLPLMQVVALHFKEGDSACAAFSDINGKGVQLSGVDLIKNFLLMEVNKRSPEISLEEADQRVWQRLRDELPQASLEDFFHVFVYLHVTGVKKQRVYAEMTQHFKQFISGASLDSYVELLLTTARAFKEVSSKTRTFKHEGERFAAFCAHLVPVFGAGGKVLAITLLTAFRSGRISQKQLDQAVRYCESALLRYYFYGETNNVTKAVGEYARLLQSAKGTAFLETLKENLTKRLYPSDSDLRPKLLAFSDPKWTTKNARAIRYALWMLEQTVLSSPTPVDSYAVEHIWPRSWEKTTWARNGVSAASVAPLISGFGNFALIQPKLNSELGNKDSSSKMAALMQCGVFTNQQYFASVSEWTPSAIQARREWLVDQLLSSALAQLQ